MALIECSKCGGRISTLLLKCPKCGTLQKRADAPPTARRIESDTLAWAKKWAHIGAWSVIAGFLIPIPWPQGHLHDMAWGALWSWDFFKSETFFPIGLTMPPLAGLGVLVLLFMSRDELLPRFMTFIGAFTIVVELALGLYLTSGPFITSGDVALSPSLTGLFLMCALAAIGAFVIAAGNRVRKTLPLHPWPRRISGIGGILLLLIFAIPWYGHPPITAFFSREDWSTGWPVMIPMLGLLAYGIAGVVCFKIFKRPQRACKIVSLLGRGALLLMPVFFIILDFVTFETMRGRAPVALVVLKAFLTLYGSMAIFGAGLAALLTLKLKTSPVAPLTAPEPAT
ncbi:MAG TPA: hypothetical protein VFS19_01195 [Planctomycetota bacterium]|nr:hypothetical protein [Planctomycetota bacterium]